MAKKQINKININNAQNTSTNMQSFEALENSGTPVRGAFLDQSQSAIANKVNELIDWQAIAEDRTIVTGFGLKIDDKTSNDVITITLDKASNDYLGFGDDNGFIDGDNFPTTFQLSDRQGNTDDYDMTQPNAILVGQYFSITNTAFPNGSTWTRTTNATGSGLPIFIVSADTTSGFVSEATYLSKVADIDTALADISEFSLDAGNRLVNVENELDNNVLKVDGTRIARTQDIYSQQQVNNLINTINTTTGSIQTKDAEQDAKITNLESSRIVTNGQIQDLAIQQAVNTTDLNEPVNGIKDKLNSSIVAAATLKGRVDGIDATVNAATTGLVDKVKTIEPIVNSSKINTDANTAAIGDISTKGTIRYELDQLNKNLQGGGLIVTAVKKYASNVGLPKESGWTASKAVFNLANIINNNDGTKPVFDFTDENIFYVKIRFTIGNPALSEKRNILFSINTGDDEPTILTFNDRAGSNANTGVILKAQLTITGTLTVEVVSVDGTAPALSVINFDDLVVTQIQEFTVSPYAGIVTSGELSTEVTKITKNTADIATLKTTVATNTTDISDRLKTSDFTTYKDANDIAVGNKAEQTYAKATQDSLTAYITSNNTAVANAVTNAESRVLQTTYDAYVANTATTLSALAKKLTPAVTGVGEELLKELETKLGI